MPGINQENAAIVSAVASAVSAFAALTAVLAVRNTNKIARANLLPVLTFENSSGNLKVENLSNGPALNLRFLPITTHFQDMDWMFEYSTEVTTIPPHKNELIKVLTKDVRDPKEGLDKGDSYDILWFAKEVGAIDALFEDTTNHTHAVRLAFSEKSNEWQLMTQKYFRYGVRMKLVNWMKRKLFRSKTVSKLRLWRYRRKEAANETG